MTPRALFSRLARRSARSVTCAVAAAVLGAGPLLAQDPQDPGQGFTLELEGDYLTITISESDGLPIEQFIKLAQTLTKKTFTYSTPDLSNVAENKITFIGAKRMKRDNFFPFFQTMLYIKGFATMIRGDEDTEIIEIVALTGPKRTELSSSARYVSHDEIANYANQTGVPILTSVPLAHINATAATNQLRPFFSVGAGATSALTLGAAAKALLLQGFGPQVYAAYQVLRLVDVPPDAADQEVRVQRLEYAAAEELEPILTEILESRAKAAQAVGPAGAELQAQPRSELKIVPHVSLNALLISGTRDQIIEAQELIARLDVPLDETDGDTHVVRLKNVMASELRETLHAFIQEDLTSEQQAQAGQTGASTRRPRRTVVIDHEASNSLLISGTASKFRELQRVIDELDQRQPQVLIECAVVELTSQSSMRLAFELGLVDVGGAGPFDRPFGFTSFGLTTFEDQDGDGLPDTRLPDFDNPLQGITGGIISSDDFAVPLIINALEGDSDANVLSMPSIVVNNNETAVVSNQESRPTQTVSQGTATTQAGAGDNVQAGIILTISPSISSNNYLRLNVDVEVSRFLTPFDPNAVTAGVIAERNISTQVTMPSSHTMVLGGVIEDQQDSSSSGIPVLKDIPILGWLFSSWSRQNAKTNLYFFLTPYILDEEDFSDMAEHSFRKKLEAADYIGHRRIQLIDRRWREGRPETLDDPGATIEDIDARGGFDIPIYDRPDREVDPGPITPGAVPAATDPPAAPDDHATIRIPDGP
ncbi:MAG: secretin N-terminal domain-containing protein [Planctomycetota bacterium]